MSEENKKDVLNDKKVLNENELDKVVGATSYIKGLHCPNCNTETIYYNGRYHRCDTCGYSTCS